MTTKDMLGLSVAGGRKEEIRGRLRPDHIWSIDCREELVPEQRVRRIPPSCERLGWHQRSSPRCMLGFAKLLVSPPTVGPCANTRITSTRNHGALILLAGSYR